MAAIVDTEMNNKNYTNNKNYKNNKNTNPIRVVVTVDVSGSMEGLLGRLLEELKVLVSCMQPETVIQINYFNMSWIPGPIMTAAEVSTNGITAPMPDGGTSLYYAVHRAFQTYPCSEEEPIVYIFISDGCNTERGDYLEASQKSMRDSFGTKIFLGTTDAIPESTRMGFEENMTFAFDNLSLEGAACPDSDDELEGASCPDSDDELEGAACPDESPCKKARCQETNILPDAFKALVLSKL